MYLASMRRNNKEGFDGVITEESVSLMSITRLHLIISIQTFESCSGDVNLAEKYCCNNTTKQHSFFSASFKFKSLNKYFIYNSFPGDIETKCFSRNRVQHILDLQ